MDFNISKVLEIDNNKGDYLEFKNDEYATLWLKDGSCMAIMIKEIQHTGFSIIDEDDEETFIEYDEIKDIQEIKIHIKKREQK